MIMFFLLLIDEFNEALQWASKIPKDSPWSQYAYGWIDIVDLSTSNDSDQVVQLRQDAMKFLIQVVFIKERQKKHELLKDLLSQSSYLPLHIEYTYALFESGAYTEIKSLDLKLQTQPNLNFDIALTYFLTSYFLNDDDGKINLEQLVSTLHRTEYMNPSLLSILLQLFLNLSYDQNTNISLPQMSSILLQLGKRLVELLPQSSNAYKQLGFVHYRLNNTQPALEAFQKALDIDPECVSALEGQLLVQLKAHGTMENTKDLELLQSMGGGTSPLAHFLCYLHYWHHAHQPDQAFFFLKEVVQKTFDQIASSNGLSYFVSMDLHLLRLAGDALLDLCPANPVMLASDPMHALTELTDYFQHVYPGSGDSLYLKALTKYLHHQTGSFIDGFQGLLNSTFPLHFSCALILAEMYMDIRKFTEAQAALDGALASNLEANRNGFFLILRSKLDRLMRKDPSVVLENIDIHLLNQRQKVCFFSELAWRQVSVQKSEDIIREGKTHVFGIHHSELDLEIAEIYMHHHHYDRALNLFDAIQNPCFQIHQRIADWYYQRRDLRMYLETCKKWVDEQGTQIAYMGLAQAYLVLEDVDHAIDTLNLALCCYPEDPSLILEISKILTLHHAYSRAMDYLQQSDAPQCRLALAQLHFKMHQDSKVMDVLVNLNPIALTHEMHAVLAKVYLRQHQNQKASEHLHLAMKGFKQPSELAETYHQLYEIHQDIEYLHRSVAAHPTKKALVLLAQHAIDHRSWNQADSCIQDLFKISSPQDLDLKYLQIDLWIQQRFFDKAFQLQQEILKNSPMDFKLLSGYLSLAYRMGRLDEAEKKLNEISEVEHAGAFYCKGLCFKYHNKVFEAVLEFRKCQGDLVWQPQALQQILEFLIFPNISEIHTPLDSSTLEKANLIIQELPESDLKVFWGICLLCGSKKKNDLEKALSLAQTLPPNSTLSFFSQSFIYIMMKNESKAKNYLKRLAKDEWRYKDALLLETG
ncbi:Tetratricopeptide repeat protein 21B [Coelomomyces lativittatus]|nr:Tetratricopeptide repeat protein 21B [Coelomomyces lativittatus]